MPHSKSAVKRLKQNEQDRLLNKSAKTAMRTAIKKVVTAVDSGNLDLLDQPAREGRSLQSRHDRREAEQTGRRTDFHNRLEGRSKFRGVVS